MNASLVAGLIFWGTMARVLSELMTWSVEHTQQGLLWLCNGMWAGAAGMVVYAVYRWFRDERGQTHKEGDCRFNLSMQHPFQLSLSVF